MEAKRNFRVTVMKYAWQIWRNTSNAWRVCLIKAWELYRLAKKMRKGIVSFWYEKADGTIRKAFGTLKDIPAGTAIRPKRESVPTYKTLCYYDVEKQSFRSFKVENLIAIF